jgi:Fe-S-cluster containining protein
MCKNQDGNGFTCAIHSTRPLVCREFRCYRMLIFNREGHPIGRVIGHNDIRTSDDVLTRLWKEKVVHLPHAHSSCANDPEWVTMVTGILEKNGYRGDPVE